MGWFSKALNWLHPPAIKVPVIVEPEPSTPSLRSIPQCGLFLIQQVEGYKDTAYHDQKGILTIGFGHTEGVKEGDTCTKEQASAWLREDAKTAWGAILKVVKVPLTSNNGGALLSFVYNVGVTAFKESTLLTILNSGNYSGVPEQMKKWVFENKPDGSKVISQGLVNRRNAEVNLWVGSDWRQI